MSYVDPYETPYQSEQIPQLLNEKGLYQGQSNQCARLLRAAAWINLIPIMTAYLGIDVVIVALCYAGGIQLYLPVLTLLMTPFHGYHIFKGNLFREKRHLYVRKDPLSPVYFRLLYEYFAGIAPKGKTILLFSYEETRDPIDHQRLTSFDETDTEFRVLLEQSVIEAFGTDPKKFLRFFINARPHQMTCGMFRRISEMISENSTIPRLGISACSSILSNGQAASRVGNEIRFAAARGRNEVHISEDDYYKAKNHNGLIIFIVFIPAVSSMIMYLICMILRALTVGKLHKKLYKNTYYQSLINKFLAGDKSKVSRKELAELKKWFENTRIQCRTNPIHSVIDIVQSNQFVNTKDLSLDELSAEYHESRVG